MLKLSSGREVDFVESDAALDEASVLVQVRLDMSNPKTETREVAALEEAMERFGCARSLIVTFDEERDILTSTGCISVRPAWKWLLED